MLHWPARSALKSLQMIAGWIAQVLQGQRSIDLPQFPQSEFLNIAWKLATPLATPDSLGLFVTKRADHGRSLIRETYQGSQAASIEPIRRGAIVHAAVTRTGSRVQP